MCLKARFATARPKTGLPDQLEGGDDEDVSSKMMISPPLLAFCFSFDRLTRDKVMTERAKKKLLSRVVPWLKDDNCALFQAHREGKASGRHESRF